MSSPCSPGIHQCTCCMLVGWSYYSGLHSYTRSCFSLKSQCFLRPPLQPVFLDYLPYNNPCNTFFSFSFLAFLYFRLMSWLRASWCSKVFLTLLFTVQFFSSWRTLDLGESLFLVARWSLFLYFSFWFFWCLSSLFSTSISLRSLSLAFLVVFLPAEWLRQNKKLQRGSLVLQIGSYINSDIVITYIQYLGATRMIR